MSIENPLEDILQTSIPYKEQQNALIRNQEIQNQYLPEKLRLANENQMNVNKWYGPNIQSEIGNRNALTQKYNTMTPLEAAHQQLENEWYARKAQADINYKNMGGGRGSTGSKDDYAYQQSFARDNPNFTEDELRQGREAHANGETTLPNGKTFFVSRDTQRAYDRAYKSTTTAGLINAGVTANQAEAELPIYKEAIDSGVKPYGTTVFNTSPQQIKDALNVKDHNAQKRLGNYLAAQQLLFDRAALMLKINALPAGVNIASEIKHLAAQTINEKFPRMSAEARQIASDKVAEVVNAGLKARNAYGVGASGAAGKRGKQGGGATLRYNPETGDFERIG